VITIVKERGRNIKEEDDLSGQRNKQKQNNETNNKIRVTVLAILTYECTVIKCTTDLLL
jgi:hypothetical protein